MRTTVYRDRIHVEIDTNPFNIGHLGRGARARNTWQATAVAFVAFPFQNQPEPVCRQVFLSVRFLQIAHMRFLHIAQQCGESAFVVSLSRWCARAGDSVTGEIHVHLSICHLHRTAVRRFPTDPKLRFRLISGCGIRKSVSFRPPSILSCFLPLLYCAL